VGILELQSYTFTGDSFYGVRENGVPSKGSRIYQMYSKAWYDSYSHHKRPNGSWDWHIF
jgi:hypothetical protein